MNEQAFQLLETLAETQVAALEREAKRSQEEQLKLNFAVDVFQLRDLLDKARHAQKGGA